MQPEPNPDSHLCDLCSSEHTCGQGTGCQAGLGVRPGSIYSLAV